MDKIDSNVTGLAFAEEATLKTLPVTPNWYELEPNSYSDFGGEISTVARAPISASRQRKKGTPTGVTASGGYNSDYTQNNMTRLLQGFFFADAHEKPDTTPLNGAAVAFTNVDGLNNEYEAATGLAQFAVSDLVFATGFAVPANNGLSKVVTSAAGVLGVTKDLAAEAAPPSSARLVQVGVEFAAGDATLTVAAGVTTLGTTAYNLTTLSLQPGEWVFLGGDLVGEHFVSGTNKPGYARIVSIAPQAIVFDKTTWTPVTDAGAGKTVRMFFGTFIRNEDDPALIKRRTYNLERKLGSDGAGVQTEYLVGAVANELTLNIPKKDKLNADLSFVALDNEQRDGATGPKAGNRIAALGEDAFNTSSDVWRIRMSIIDPVNTLPSPLFAYVTEGTIMVNNNVTGAEAVGVFGAFDTILGNFEVSGKVTAYFSTVAAVQAVRNNADVTIDMIVAARNAGFIYDIPLLGLGGGRLNIEKDAAITVPLEMAGAENDLGYSCGLTVFNYLPSAAMPA